ncbi:hypothetical protein PT447_00180 [Aliarcobacter butzleri]|uniref:hypothetical protein n=1 Tax=Aliarcobacter butzleri TaxID=28197 RepID=UPI0024DEFC0A|nr:hypothetical protein [Aliarcobacter butzleri]MDK2063336.1 hypothetical protein [Aliarcobacter butzleri]
MKSIINANGDEIQQNFIMGNPDLKKIKEILEKDTTTPPSGYKKLWFSVYGGKIFITNLTDISLKEYTL